MINVTYRERALCMAEQVRQMFGHNLRLTPLSLRPDRLVFSVGNNSGLYILRAGKASVKSSLERTVSALAHDLGVASKPYATCKLIDGWEMYAECFQDGKNLDRHTGTLPSQVHASTLLRVADSLRLLYSVNPSALRSLVTFPTSVEDRLNGWIAEGRALGVDGTSEAETLLKSLGSLRLMVEPTVIHGDLRPQNILVAAGSVCLIDFEQATWGNPVYDIAKLLVSIKPDEALKLQILQASLGSAECDIVDAVQIFAEVHAYAVRVWTARQGTLERNPYLTWETLIQAFNLIDQRPRYVQ